MKNYVIIFWIFERRKTMNNVVYIVLVYIVISFIGILLHDFKYLFFLNSNNRVKAVIICGVYVIFNTMTTKLIADQPMQISIPVITVTNMISMWIAMTYNEKNLKEFIYKFEISTKFDDKKDELENWFKDNNVPYKRFWYYFENDKSDEKGETKYHEFDIYAFTKQHSKRLTEMLDKYDRFEVKYVKINTSNYKEAN